jgi:hypothetical protein
LVTGDEHDTADPVVADVAEPRKTNQSFKSWAYALTVFGDFSTSVR